MTDHFTCPACGWPQGPTHTTVWPSELVARIGTDDLPTSSHSAHLAAPQGQRTSPVTRDEMMDCYQLAGEKILKQAECDGLGSMLLEVQQDCIKATQELTAAKAENEANATAYCETEAELTKVRDELEAAKAEIERIRDVYECQIDQHQAVIADLKAEIADADHLADLQQREIERLRSQSDVEDYNETKAENETLRAALETIRDHPNSRGCTYDAEIARAALTRRGE